MIALLLAAQLSAQLSTSHLELFRSVAPHERGSEIVSALPPPKPCGASVGRMEVSLAQPAALYRKGDRPAKGMKNWVDYPNGQLCLAESPR
jgi:hypothetical protein